MYTSNPSFNIKRRLNRHASTILLGGIFLFFSLSFFMAMCKVPCETASAEHHLLNKVFHEGHEPQKRDYEELKENTSLYVKKKTHLVIIILSGPLEYQRRNVIRSTWLSESHKNVSTYFVVGTFQLPILDIQKIHSENEKYSDLLIFPNLKDSYTILTKKLLETFKWLHEKVDFNFMFKADDDTFARIDVILEELRFKPLERLYWGFFDGRANVKKTGQWAERNWILCDKYGPHARGGGYILSYDLVSYIASNSNFFQKFSSEDISVGAWLGPLDIHREHDPRFDTEYVSRGCNNEYIVTHKQSPNDMTEKWDNIKKLGVLCKHEIRTKLSYIYNWKVLPSQCCFRNSTKVP